MRSNLLVVIPFAIIFGGLMLWAVSIASGFVQLLLGVVTILGLFAILGK